MENEPPKEELTEKETETLDKIIEKLLAVKKYLYIYFLIINWNNIVQQIKMWIYLKLKLNF